VGVGSNSPRCLCHGDSGRREIKEELVRDLKYGGGAGPFGSLLSKVARGTAFARSLPPLVPHSVQTHAPNTSRTHYPEL